MENKYSKYTDDILIQMMENGLDLDENMFEVLTELGIRKHPKTKDYCIRSLYRDLGYDEYFVSSAFSTLYSIDENEAILFAKNNYEKFHGNALKTLLSELWIDSKIYKENPKKVELVKLLKQYLVTLPKEQIIGIQDDYSEFMNAYKNI
ncbi:hypothetical protein ATE49_12455 [Elizabethkingia miricola]|uniref:DUF4375 domain-containing protein n=1 Tax=Elizabethkingia miricola TaxID=172045 RepID=A0ABY3NBL1_ELIMR|nr:MULTISPECIES: hypothetical protein [Elizabethkingia]OBS13468.1 hypothetical protein ATE49_12455 [Elizabethkingia miricola]TYO85272.1 hypothetical protein LX74_03507 [Elizabethkingia miricola]